MMRSTQLAVALAAAILAGCGVNHSEGPPPPDSARAAAFLDTLERSEEHTSELQSQSNLVCRLLLEKKKLMVEDHTDTAEQLTSLLRKAGSHVSCEATE